MPAKKKTSRARAPAKKKTSKARAPAKKKTSKPRAPAKKKTSKPRAPAKTTNARPAVPAQRPSRGVLPAQEAAGAPAWLRSPLSGDERRRFLRVRHETKVRLVAGERGQTTLEATLRSVDISLSGIFLRSTFFLPEGTPVRVEIPSLRDRRAVATGVVARVVRDDEEGGIGIAFDRFEESSIADLVLVLLGERLEDFAERFSKQTRAGGGVDLIRSAVLAWEMERLSLTLSSTAD